MSSKMDISKVCEYCGAIFTAHTAVTRFCSHKCASRAYKSRRREEKLTAVSIDTERKIKEKSIESIVNKPMLTITETATYIGVSRPTIYSYLKNKELKSVQLGGKRFIRRSDIDKLFENAETYKAKPERSDIMQPITELYTIAEIKEKYNVKEGWIFKIAKEKHIPKTLHRGKSYLSKKHVDRHFKKYLENEEIKDWYSVEDIMSTFGLTRNAVYSFVYENNIPKKKNGREVRYSKLHFDIAKGVETEDVLYYTAEEAMSKYNIPRDSLYWYLKRYDIARKKEGRYIKILKTELDKILKEPTI
jgi:excisionase family DNA binding protein